jgi:ubiquinone/menaquinone biosynthesis C-methylase UbiE
MKQHQEIVIDTLVDIIKPENSPLIKSNLLAKKFFKVDITKEKLPFKDKEFDVCLCTHTLEDLYNPFTVMDEMARVAKRGYISTPSMGKDMEYSHFNLTDWKTGPRRVPGVGHHKWFFVNDKGVIKVIPKNYPLLSTSKFHITKWLGEDEFQYLWTGKISYEEVKELDFRVLIKTYSSFVKENKSDIKYGPVLIFLDNPFFVLKEWAKFFLK